MSPLHSATLVDALCRTVGTNLSYHDYSGGRLADVLGAERRNHTNAFCSAVKPRSSPGENACTRCDIGMVQARLSSGCGAFLKQCHAGVCELVLPVRTGSQLTGALFVGPFLWDTDQPLPEGALVQRAVRRRSQRVERERSRLPVLGPVRVGDTQSLCELLLLGVAREMAEHDSVAPRAGYHERIDVFLRAHSADPVRLGDLAKALFLSESRTSSLVRRHFSMTFPELLTEHRLVHAKRLLAGSHLTAAAVARAVGFVDPTYFHRVFHRHEGLSPLQYRRREWKGGGPQGV